VLAGAADQPSEHLGAGRHGQGQRPGVRRDEPAVQHTGEFGVAPLPVGRSLDAEVVLWDATLAEGDDRKRCRLLGSDGVRQVDPVAGEVGVDPATEGVVGDAGQQPHRHTEPGQADRDVGGAAPRCCLE
jgi:hypothetical protein